MQRRLKSAGQRPISALVDITNYVMLDVGRPAHAYDIAKLDRALVARPARDGEKVLALNEKEYTLDPTMTVIADEREVHDIGGIMGGEHSGVSDGTTDVMIEIAFFTPDRIAQTGQKLGLTSDARSRFERGVDPAFLSDGLDIAYRAHPRHLRRDASDAIHVGAPALSKSVRRYDPRTAHTPSAVSKWPKIGSAKSSSSRLRVCDGMVVTRPKLAS